MQRRHCLLGKCVDKKQIKAMERILKGVAKKLARRFFRHALRAQDPKQRVAAAVKFDNVAHDIIGAAT